MAIGIAGRQPLLHIGFELDVLFGERLQQCGLHDAEIFVQIQRLHLELRTATGSADAFAEIGDADGGLPDVLHVFRDAGIEIFGHQNEAAEALNDGEEVVELVCQATQQLLMKALAVLIAKLEMGGEDELHGCVKRGGE
jgi:hypothetical protein